MAADFKTYKKTYKYTGLGLFFYAAMHYIVGFGFIACTLFMCTNYYLADETFVKETHKIIRKGDMSGGRRYRSEHLPLFTIDYHGTEKVLVFSHEYYHTMNNYYYVEVEVKKGFLGFDVLDNQRLLK